MADAAAHLRQTSAGNNVAPADSAHQPAPTGSHSPAAVHTPAGPKTPAVAHPLGVAPAAAAAAAHNAAGGTGPPAAGPPAGAAAPTAPAAVKKYLEIIETPDGALMVTDPVGNVYKATQVSEQQWEAPVQVPMVVHCVTEAATGDQALDRAVRLQSRIALILSGPAMSAALGLQLGKSKVELISQEMVARGRAAVAEAAAAVAAAAEAEAKAAAAEAAAQETTAAAEPSSEPAAPSGMVSQPADIQQQQQQPTKPVAALKGRQPTQEPGREQQQQQQPLELGKQQLSALTKKQKQSPMMIILSMPGDAQRLLGEILLDSMMLGVADAAVEFEAAAGAAAAAASGAAKASRRSRAVQQQEELVSEMAVEFATIAVAQWEVHNKAWFVSMMEALYDAGKSAAVSSQQRKRRRIS